MTLADVRDSRAVATQPAVRSGLRTDIQGLRALAVGLVVFYHLFPTRLTGGFVGVDVFLVISGFLITSHLLARPPRRVADLLEFWARRLRRLLPASLVVLGATLVVSRLVAPETQWENTGRQVGAATLYVVNWLLAADSIDYLAADLAPSPVQHFWSLSVEEQFYFGWPLLILVLTMVSLRLGRRWRAGSVLLAGVSAVVAASLVFSVLHTAASPASAYFITPTRVWELGAGGLLAAALARHAASCGPTPVERRPLVVERTVLAWAGLAMICWSAWSYSAATPFPGWHAAVPVVGTVLIILANPLADERLSPGPWLARPSAQWLGDVSYSVYLWHWPLIALVPYVSGGRLGILDKLAILLVTLVLAAATKRHVEDRFRRAPAKASLARPYGFAALGMAVVLGMVGLQLVEAQHREGAAEEKLARALAGDEKCFGAAAFTEDGCQPVTTEGPVLPGPVQAVLDKSDAYADVSGKDCWASKPAYRLTTCHFGDLAGSIEVALVGNSHAGHWLPALQSIAERRGWRVTTYLASRCALTTTRQLLDNEAETDACLRWVRRAVSQVGERRPDLVVMSNLTYRPAEGRSSVEDSLGAYTEGYAEVLEQWTEQRLPVVAIRDTPIPGINVPDCVAENPDDLRACAAPRDERVTADPLEVAAEQISAPYTRVVDVNDRICTSRTCPAVVGGVVAYFDRSHLTATFARTLAPYLQPHLLEALREAPRWGGGATGSG